MKALVLTDYFKFDYMDVEKPKIGADDVLINVKACAICGSDVHGYDGQSGRRIPPIIMGHEASGVIAEVGENVTKYQAGDKVTFDSTIYCGECYYCKQGLINLCENRMVLGVSCSDYRNEGAMAEYVAIPSRILYRIPGGVTFNQAAMVEPLSIAVHAVRISPVKIGYKAVVLGAGTIGLLLIQCLKTAGCSEIIVVDLDDSKLETAKKFGATQTIGKEEADTTSRILKLTNGRGADIAFEAVGINPTFNTAVACVRRGGSVVLVGNVSPKVDFPLQSCVTRQISLFGSCASAGEYDICLDLISRHKVDVDSLISQAVPLSEGGIWFDKLHAQEPGLIKVVLNP
jgi:L-iditol 2-dehydrogenase